jgi:hypothetical protein
MQFSQIPDLLEFIEKNVSEMTNEDYQEAFLIVFNI